MQQADLVLVGYTAQPVQASRQPGETQRSHFEISLEANRSPGRRRNVGDTASYAVGGSSAREHMPNKAVSAIALRSEERTPDKDRRRSSARGAATEGTSPLRRCSISPDTCDMRDVCMLDHTYIFGGVRTHMLTPGVRLS